MQLVQNKNHQQARRPLVVLLFRYSIGSIDTNRRAAPAAALLHQKKGR